MKTTLVRGEPATSSFITPILRISQGTSDEIASSMGRALFQGNNESSAVSLSTGDGLSPSRFIVRGSQGIENDAIIAQFLLSQFHLVSILKGDVGSKTIQTYFSISGSSSKIASRSAPKGHLLHIARPDVQENLSYPLWLYLGTDSCSEIQKMKFGRTFDLQRSEEREELHKIMVEKQESCQSVTSTGARLTAEVIVEIIRKDLPFPKLMADSKILY
jgi:hypothetical protein